MKVDLFPTEHCSSVSTVSLPNPLSSLLGAENSDRWEVISRLRVTLLPCQLPQCSAIIFHLTKSVIASHPGLQGKTGILCFSLNQESPQLSIEKDSNDKLWGPVPQILFEDLDCELCNASIIQYVEGNSFDGHTLYNMRQTDPRGLWAWCSWFFVPF